MENKESGIVSGDWIVSAVTGVCVLLLAVVSKYMIEDEMDFVSQYGPVWIYIAYGISPSRERRQRRSMMIWSIVIAATTAAIILVYAL